MNRAELLREVARFIREQADPTDLAEFDSEAEQAATTLEDIANWLEGVSDLGPAVTIETHNRDNRRLYIEPSYRDDKSVIWGMLAWTQHFGAEMQIDWLLDNDQTDRLIDALLHARMLSMHAD